MVLAVTLFAVWIGVGAETAEEKERRPANPPNTGNQSGSPPPKEQKAGKDSKRTVYVPPSRGAPGARTGGGTRGNADAPRVAVLAPDHVGLTTREQPMLAWYLSAETRAPIELTVIADGAVEPLAVKRLPGPMQAGIHLVDLAQQGVRLEQDTTYDWYVALVLDPNARDADVVAGGAIQRRAATPQLSADLRGGEPSYRVLARHGIWYDSIADLSAAIVAAPADSAAGQALRAERAALLEQVGVGAVALYEREGGDGPPSRP
jgi:hypothetical protein